MKGAIEGTIGMAYGKLTIKGLEKEKNVNGYIYPNIMPGCGNDPGDVVSFCQFNYGYPQADFTTLSVLVNGISAIAGADDWYIYGFNVITEADGVMFQIKITPSSNVNSGGVKSDSCYVDYRNWISRTDATLAVPPPTVQIVDCV